MKFENFLKRSNGDEIEAARALLIALRDERGIHLRYEALPHLFDIGVNENQAEGLRAQPVLIRHYAITHNLKQPEEILHHLNINGMTVSCGRYLKSKPLSANLIDAKRTIRDLQERKVIGTERSVYGLVGDYFNYLSANGISLASSKFEDTLNSKLIHQLKDLKKVADLTINFGLYTTMCRAGLTELHKDYSRILIGKEWREDYKKVAETKINAADQSLKRRTVSNSFCPNCVEEVQRQLKSLG